ncbi:hypothetical protein CKA32_003722 [Geitlerinema sp. FC II]|nr:hypothetical protein CKA32_003722 [Geitlerinema sp. FC II]
MLDFAVVVLQLSNTRVLTIVEMHPMPPLESPILGFEEVRKL